MAFSKKSVSVKGITNAFKNLEKKQSDAAKTLNAVCGAMRRGLPGKIADNVVTQYNIKKSEVMPGKARRLKSGKLQRKAGASFVKAKTIDSVEIVYYGRRLTPTHFDMKPNKLKYKGRKGKKKVVREPIMATIKSGQTKRIHKRAFLVNVGNGVAIPFKQINRKSRKIEPIKTVSLPQMVQNEAVTKLNRTSMNKLLSDNLNKQIKRFKL